jgi:uncharacterized membrane protein
MTRGQRTLWLLRGQLLLAGLMIVVGSLLALQASGALPSHTVALGAIGSGLRHGDGAAWVSAGFVLLILTPVVRLLATAGTFVRERDWRFVGATALVLAIVVSGLVIGRG